MNETHDCPICAEPVAHRAQFPKQVCERCQSRASDAYGRRLTFSGEDLPAGGKAFYRDNGAQYPRSICYIDGRKCFVVEHRDGMIVERVEN
jgi:hypothetical protein